VFLGCFRRGTFFLVFDGCHALGGLGRKSVPREGSWAVLVSTDGAYGLVLIWAVCGGSSAWFPLRFSSSFGDLSSPFFVSCSWCLGCVVSSATIVVGVCSVRPDACLGCSLRWWELFGAGCVRGLVGKFLLFAWFSSFSSLWGSIAGVFFGLRWKVVWLVCLVLSSLLWGVLLTWVVGWFSVLFSESEKGKVVCQGSTKSDLRGFEAWTIGKFMSGEKINREAMYRVLKSLWYTKEPVNFMALKGGLFLVKFGLIEDRDRILNLSPWSFDQSLFSMVPFVKGKDMSCYSF
ncbi:hypothetical protein Goklo_004741, partial [Gossypium klotzschianum]|nr:hypothetical protein [Gossypium klotzschianum]